VPTLKTASTLLLLLSLGGPVIGQTPALDDPRALMFRARLKQQSASAEDLTGAVLLYRKVVALEPNSSEAQLRLSETLAESGDLDGALPPAEKAAELNPKNGEAWLNLGMLQSQRAAVNAGARAGAQKALLEASRYLPGDIDLWLRLAQVSQLINDDATALKAYLSLGRMHLASRMADPKIERQAWESAVLLATKLNLYESRREAIMSLCRLDDPEGKYLPLLEDLAKEQTDKGYLGHAEESFLLLGERLPDVPAIWENIARIQMMTNRFDEALKSYRQAEALKPSPQISYFEGICLMSLGRLAEAESIWRALLSSKDLPADSAELVQNARYFYASSLLLQKRPAEMLNLLQGWPSETDQADLLVLKTEGLIQTQSWKAARSSLEDGMKRFPNQSLFQDAKAMPPGLLKEGLLFKKDARQALVQLDLESMASLWSDFRQWDKCLELVNQALVASPNRRVGLLMLQSNALDEVGRPGDSIKVLRDAQKLDPAYPMLQNNLGYLLLENGGDLQEASHLIEAAMKQDPKSGSTVDSWGWVLFKQGRFQESEEALRKAVELTPYSPEIRSHLGEVLLKLNRPEEALENWERALAYVFPQRKELEAKVQKLRADIARKQNAQETSSTQSAPEEDTNDDEETP